MAGGNASSSPASSVHASDSLRGGMGRRMSIAQSPDQQQLSPVITSRDANLRVAPRLNTGEVVATNSMPRLQPHNPFSASRAQPNIQPLNSTGALSYNANGYVSQPSSVQDEQQQYIENHLPMYFNVMNHSQQQQQQQQQQHRHSVSHFPVPNTPHNTLRRNNTMPAIPQQSAAYQNWPNQMSNGMPNGSMVGGMYSPYSPNTQPQQSPHGSHHQVHGVSQTGSTPPTPVTASSYQQPMQLPPPPIPPMHQPHQQPSLVTPPPHEIDGSDDRGDQHYEAQAMAAPIRNGPIQHHSGLSYSDFLASDISAEGAVNVNDGQQAGPNK